MYNKINAYILNEALYAIYGHMRDTNTKLFKFK